MKLTSVIRKPVSMGLAALMGVMFMAMSPAHAEYPERTVSWVIPFPPGGPTDIATRVLAEAFNKELGQTFVADNRSGASGAIGVRNVIRSKPDGYTIGMLAAPSLTAPFMQENPPYNLETDIMPVGLAYVTPLILVVNPQVLPDVTDVKSLVKAGQDGKELNYTAAGVGSTSHLTMELMKKELNFEAFNIPYQGSAPAVAAVLAGDVPVMLSDAIAVMSQIKAGKLRAIAVTTDDPIEGLENVKSLKAQGVKSTKAVSWGGVFVPVGTPEATVATLNNALKKALQDPNVANRMRSIGAYPAYSDANAMAERIKVDSAIWKKVIIDGNINKK